MNVFDALKLTEGEKRVYRALIDLKSTTTGPLYKKGGVSQSKVYEILERLKQKGLAASIIKEGNTVWHPANPSIYLENIKKELEDMQQRKRILERELPHLIKRETHPADEAQVLVGYNGFRSCLYSFLSTFSPGQSFSVFGSPTPIPEPFLAFLRSYNIERVRRKINAKFLYGKSLQKFATGLYSLPRTELRFMNRLTPSSLAIGNDRIIIMEWENGGKFVVIMGKEIAKGYANFFNSLWNIAEKNKKTTATPLENKSQLP